MRQIWRRLTFLHWPYAPDLIRPHHSSRTSTSTRSTAPHGSAWSRLKYTARPASRHFPETNLRTYVIGPDGSRAVWFFSLEAARLAAVLGARIGYHLPYFWAQDARYVGEWRRSTTEAGVIGRTTPAR